MTPGAPAQPAGTCSSCTCFPHTCPAAAPTHLSRLSLASVTPRRHPLLLQSHLQLAPTFSSSRESLTSSTEQSGLQVQAAGTGGWGNCDPTRVPPPASTVDKPSRPCLHPASPHGPLGECPGLQQNSCRESFTINSYSTQDHPLRPTTCVCRTIW